MPYKVNDPDAPARPVIDDEQLKRMMNANTPGFFERNRFRLVTLVLIALNVIVFAAEAAISLLAGARSTSPRACSWTWAPCTRRSFRRASCSGS